jgi:hypothetical protein
MKRLWKYMFVMAIMVTSCKNYYNDTIHWADGIKPGTSLKEVQKLQPEFVTIIGKIRNNGTAQLFTALQTFKAAMTYLRCSTNWFFVMKSM